MAREQAYLVVTDVPRPGALAGVAVVGADDYLEGRDGAVAEGAVVINLCRSYQYLSKGYYVSLLAHARRQRVLPTLEMVEEIGNPFAYFRALQDAGVDTIDFKIIKGRGKRLLPQVIVLDGGDGPERAGQSDLLVNGGDDAALPRYERARKVYCETTCIFGRTLDERFRRPFAAVSKVYPFPLLRIRMYQENDGWVVGQVFPASLAQLSPEELELLGERLAARAFSAPRPAAPPPSARIACLWDPDDPYAPSDEDTVEKLARVASRQGVVVEVIDKGDLSSLAEYDALFIRTVTSIDNYAFTFAKVAESLGMPVIDDPQSIIRCSNKVYLHELFRRNGIPTPATWTISRKSDMEEIAASGFPVIVKSPGGTFSNAVTKVGDAEELRRVAQAMFADSPLLIAQEFTPTAFDWRVTILEHDVLFVCKYHMVKDHWQIAKRSQTGSTRFGRVEPVAIGEAPDAVKSVALEAAGLIGRGLYGVDLKETAAGPTVIEINDNPNIEAGYEDGVEKDAIYEKLVTWFLRRIEEQVRMREESPQATER